MAKSANPNQTLAMVSALLVVVGFGAIYFMFLPQLIEARNAQAIAEAKKIGLSNDIDGLTLAKANLSTEKASLEAKGAQMSNISAFFPQFEEVPNIYLQMESIISNNPNIKKFSYQVGQPSLDIQNNAKTPITITGIAPYALLKGLIVTLQDNVRPLSITQLAFTQYKNDEKDPTIPDGSYLLNLSAFVRSEKLSSSYSAAPTNTP